MTNLFVQYDPLFSGVITYGQSIKLSDMFDVEPATGYLNFSIGYQAGHSFYIDGGNIVSNGYSGFTTYVAVISNSAGIDINFLPSDFSSLSLVIESTYSETYIILGSDYTRMGTQGSTDGQVLFFDPALFYIAISSPLFTDQNEVVNFNGSDNVGAFLVDDIYNSLGGNDTITLPNLSTTIVATSPTGKVIAWDSTKVFNSGDGDDIIYGGDRNDRIESGAGNDIIADFFGTSGELLGGPGDDLIGIGQFSSGKIDGGSGTDLLGLAANIDLSKLTVSNVEVLETNGVTVTATASQFESFAAIVMSQTGIGTPINLNGPVSLILAATGSPTTLDVSDELDNEGQGRGAWIAGSNDDEVIRVASTATSALFEISPNVFAANIIDGGGGDDSIEGGDKTDLIIGGSGWDTAVFPDGKLDEIDGFYFVDPFLGTPIYAAAFKELSGWDTDFLIAVELAKTIDGEGNATGTQEIQRKLGASNDMGTAGGLVFWTADFTNFTWANYSQGEILDIASAAFRTWAGAADIQFQYAEQLDGLRTDNPIIAISFASLNGANTDPSEYIFGETDIPTYTSYSSADDSLNKTPLALKLDSNASLSDSELTELLIHEIGHSIGLYHISSTDALGGPQVAVMNSGGLATRTQLLRPDIAYAQYVYGVPKGLVSEGYISGATVFADANGNGALDGNESSVITDSFGRFASFSSTAPLISIGGTDTSTGLAFTGLLSAPASYLVISPLTTLVAILNSQGVDVDTSERAVIAALGLSQSIDFSIFDPVAVALAGGASGAAAQVAAAKVYDTSMLIGSVLAGSGGALSSGIQSGFSAIVSAITAGTLDMGDPVAVAALVQSAAENENVVLLLEAVEAVSTIIVSGNVALDALLEQNGPEETQLLDAISSIQLVLQGAASSSIEAAAGNANALASLELQFSGSNLDALATLAAAALAEEGQNQAPVALAQFVTGDEDTPIMGSLVGVDINLDPLIYGIVTNPTNGTIEINGNHFIYIPVENYNGSDSFTFKANDGNADSLSATVTITVDPVNDPAVIGGAATGAVTEDEVLSVTGRLTISDVDLNESSFQPGTIKGDFGALALAADGKWTYTLDNANGQVQALKNSQSLTDVLQVQSVDGTAADVTITINGTDDIVAINGTQRGEKIKGTDGDDLITPLGGTDFVDAGKGNDFIKATINDGSDFYNGGAGSDTVDYSALTQGVTVKLSNIFGLSGGIVTGRQSGTDLLTSIENVTGSQAADSITGNKLANIIEGSGGNDRLTGAGGSDTFVFDTGFGKDVVTDFSVSGPSHDILQFSTDLFADWASIETAISDTAKGAVITTAAGDTITLVEVTKAELVDNHVDDFLFA